MTIRMRYWIPVAVLVLTLIAAVSLVSAQPTDTSERPFLGVQLMNIDGGVAITNILAGSPAAEADLQIDDLIEAVNGEPVASPNDVAAAIRQLTPGDTVTLDLLRGDEPLSIEVVLGALPERPMQSMADLSVTYDANAQTWTIVRLSEDTPLFEAGLREGDIITAIDGEPRDPDDLMALLWRDRGRSSRETFTLTIERAGETVEIDVDGLALRTLVMGSMAAMFEEGLSPLHDFLPLPFDLMPEIQGRPFGLSAQNGRLGVVFEPLTAELAAELDLDVSEGALIREVQADSPAAEAGLLADDIVTAVNGEPVDAERTLRDRLFAYEPGDTVTLDVLRGGETLQIDVTLGEPQPGFMQWRFGRDGRGRDWMPFEPPMVPRGQGPLT